MNGWGNSNNVRNLPAEKDSGVLICIVIRLAVNACNLIHGVKIG